MAKGPGSSISTGQGITGQQLQIASDANARSTDQYNQYKKLIQPMIDRDTALATGNRSLALSAAMPTLTKLSEGFAGSKDALMNMPPGAARDRALADLQRQTYTGMAGAQADLVRGAPAEMAGMGGQVGNMSLQDLGAALSGLQGGAQTNQGVGQMQAQQQKAMLDFFSGLASTGASFFPTAKICWVAESLYGVGDPRTWIIRAYLNGPRADHWAVTVYKLIGRQVAWCARRSRYLRAALRPLFDRVLAKAIAHYNN